MAQIRDGQAIVVNGDATVVAADADVDWTDASPGDLFLVPSSVNGSSYFGGVPYYINSTTDPGSSGSGKWELELSAPFAKPSGTVFYAIAIDRFPVTGAPRILAGDVDTRALFDLALGIFDTYLDDVATGGTEPEVGPLQTHGKVIAGEVGSLQIAMVFSPALPGLPIYIGRPVIIKDNPLDDNINAVSIEQVTNTGYIVNLTAPAVAGQLINNMFIPPLSGGELAAFEASDVKIHSKTVAAPETGTDTIVMAFSPPLASVPSFVGRPVFKKSAPGEDNIDAISVDTITTTGYNVNLSGAAVAGQILSNIYIL